MSKTGPINIAVYASTDVGRVRQGNEDNFLVLNLSTAETWTADEEAPPTPDLLAFSQNYYGTVVAVSDGMGGALAGEVASNLAVHTVRDRMLEYQKDEPFKKLSFSERLRLSVEQANSLIHSESIQNPQYAGMGATFTGAGLINDELYVAQIGDSRAYLIRGGQIQQMTRDQSLVGSLVEAGHITEEEAETHAYRNVILQALGATPSINVDVRRLKGQPRDVLLLCSDGLSGKVRSPEMLEIVTSAESLKDACAALIAKANERGGEDNITVVLIQISGEGLQEPPDDGNFDFDTVPRDPELNDITRVIEEKSRAYPGVDNDTQEMFAGADEITLNESEPDERARAEPATTKPLGGKVTQVLDSSRLAAATQPLDSARTEQLASATTEPLNPPTTTVPVSDNNKTVPFNSTPVPNVAASPAASAATKRLWLLPFGMVGLLMGIIGIVLILGAVFFVVWKFILHR
ncbi:MAG TPA: Stp1/IreP family PP2C-type Ser/Thr phosphatase [Blastocatellia bacterium]|nr:Stp1/IreP family PP2C-type Ser/Thr phosphatase [Blastocatellia bacterium]